MAKKPQIIENFVCVLSNNWGENLFSFPNFVDFRKLKYKGTKCPSFANSLFYAEKNTLIARLHLIEKVNRKEIAEVLCIILIECLIPKNTVKVYIY